MLPQFHKIVLQFLTIRTQIMQYTANVSNKLHRRPAAQQQHQIFPYSLSTISVRIAALNESKPITIPVCTRQAPAKKKKMKSNVTIF